MNMYKIIMYSNNKIISSITKNHYSPKKNDIDIYNILKLLLDDNKYLKNYVHNTFNNIALLRYTQIDTSILSKIIGDEFNILTKHFLNHRENIAYDFSYMDYDTLCKSFRSSMIITFKYLEQNKNLCGHMAIPLENSDEYITLTLNIECINITKFCPFSNKKYKVRIEINKYKDNNKNNEYYESLTH